MFTVFNALVALVGVIPVLVFFDNAIVAGLIALCAAIMLGRYVFATRPGEAGHLMKIIRWPAVAAALLLLWFVIQLMPISATGISRSIWDSASGALNIPLWAGISIDPGMTIVAMNGYLTALAIAFLSAGLSIDRANAERLLFAGGIATVAMAFILIVGDMSGWLPASALDTFGTRAALVAGATYGTIYCAAITIMILERFETRRNRDSVWSHPLFVLAASTGGFAMCCSGVLFAAPTHAATAMAGALAAIAIIYAVRRLGLGAWAAISMSVVAVFAIATLIVTKGNPAAADIAVRYATAPAEMVTTVNRIIGEVGFAGTGAGTFRAIYRLYGATADSAVTPPTFAAQIAIELGRPALWVLVATMAGVVFLCVRGAFSRGRDSFYAAAGAGTGVATVLMAFGDPSAANPAIAILLACTFGLALAQSISRKI